MAYPTDLSDEQWRAIRPLFRDKSRGGRPPRYSRRRMVNAMLWVAKTGSQWRTLPGAFPPWGAVWQQFRRWRDSGLWARVLRRLHRLVRVKPVGLQSRAW